MTDVYEDSDELRVDFTGVATGFQLLPDGWYQARVTGTETKAAGDNAKNPGSKYISVEFTISDGEFQGRKQWTNYSLVSNALPMLKGFLAASGVYTEEELDGNFSLRLSELIGAELDIKVGHKPYQGEDRNQVNKVAAAGTGSAGDTSGSGSSGGSMLP